MRRALSHFLNAECAKCWALWSSSVASTHEKKRKAIERMGAASGAAAARAFRRWLECWNYASWLRRVLSPVLLSRRIAQLSMCIGLWCEGVDDARLRKQLRKVCSFWAVCMVF